MKKSISLCLSLALALGLSTTAQAEYRNHGGHHRPQHHSANHNWAGPAALLAITGLAIGAAVYSQQNAQPVYSAPPPPVQQMQPSSGNWYYCGSAGQYYPYVRYCQEGWQEVMPPR